VIFAGIELLVHPHADLRTIQVSVTNAAGNTLLYNAANIHQHFVIRSDSGNLPVIIDRTTQIVPGGQETFTLTTPQAYSGYILEYRVEHYKVIIVL
jgi:hypothetical protein